MLPAFLKDDFANTLIILLAIVLCVIFFDRSSYTNEEIAWCKQHKPYVPQFICAYNFGR